MLRDCASTASPLNSTGLVVDNTAEDAAKRHLFTHFCCWNAITRTTFYWHSERRQSPAAAQKARQTEPTRVDQLKPIYKEMAVTLNRGSENKCHVMRTVRLSRQRHRSIEENSADALYSYLVTLAERKWRAGRDDEKHLGASSITITSGLQQLCSISAFAGRYGDQFFSLIIITVGLT